MNPIVAEIKSILLNSNDQKYFIIGKAVSLITLSIPATPHPTTGENSAAIIAPIL